MLAQNIVQVARFEARLMWHSGMAQQRYPRIAIMGKAPTSCADVGAFPCSREA